MKNVFIALLVCLSLVICATSGRAADPWSNQDIVLQAIVQGTLFLDYLQTRQIAKQPEHYHEKNPILGEHPSPASVLLYFAGVSVVHAAVSHFLPAKLRPYWQGATIAVEVYTIQKNYSIGLTFRF